MNLHGNAKLSPATRRLLVGRVLQEGWAVNRAADSVGVSERTAYKWLCRFKEGGEAALLDRTSRPLRCPHRTSSKLRRRILALRKKRLVAWEIAERVRVPRSTVSRVLSRHGVGQLKHLDPKPVVQRYEKSRPGELVHVDIKKLARFERPGHRAHGDRRKNSKGAGWECAHVAVDAYTRIAFAEVLPDEKKETVADFLTRACQSFKERGIHVERVLTDRGPGYSSKVFSQRCADLGLKHSRTRPYRPQTNGKAERFIQTLTNKWAYAKTYSSSRARAKALPRWIDFYNDRKPHHAIGGITPSECLSRFE